MLFFDANPGMKFALIIIEPLGRRRCFSEVAIV